MEKRFCTDKTPITVDGKVTGEVNGYTYYGKLVTADNNKKKEIDRRITEGWRRFGQCGITMCLERRIMNRRDPTRDDVLSRNVVTDRLTRPVVKDSAKGNGTRDVGNK